MTTEVKELVKRLRDTYWSGAPYMRELLDKSADALEAMAGEVERLKRELSQVPAWRSGMTKRAEAAESERDRLQLANARMKAALDKARLFIVDQYASDEDADKGEWLAKEARPIHATICKALGGDA